MMSYWGLYFLVKVGLHHKGLIALNWWFNLAFALAVIWPMASARWRGARLVLALPLAVALAYSESFLPTPERVLSQMGALRGFSADYMLELVQRIVKPTDLLVAAVVLFLYAVLAQRIRFSSLAVLAIFSVPAASVLQSAMAPNPMAVAALAPAADPTGASGGVAAVAADPDSQLKVFYQTEAQRKMALSAGGQTPPFDVIVLNVCSLGWDDMDFVGLRDHPLLQRFDVVFNQFNTAASYSGPGLIRLMHGTCGQLPQKAMYAGLDPQCYVFPSLEKIGYRTAGLMNHDGVFDKFGETVMQTGGLAGKMEDNRAAPVSMHSFDGTPIYSDHALLSQWWTDRPSKGAQPVALYYNTISLHDGNRVPGMTSRSSADTYKPRLTQLFADFDKFLSELESTDRPVVVMLIPEHGASLRGDKLQISGMREIPSPRVTLVPAAIKVVGPGFTRPASPLLVDKPTSFYGMFSLLNDLLGHPPYGASAPDLATRLAAIPPTTLVSENEDVVVMGNQTQGFQIKSGNGAWLPYKQ